MPWRKIPLIDVIKINSKNILDIISKYDGSIDKIIDGRNKHCNNKTPDQSIFKKHSNDYKNLMKLQKK